LKQCSLVSTSPPAGQCLGPCLEDPGLVSQCSQSTCPSIQSLSAPTGDNRNDAVDTKATISHTVTSNPAQRSISSLKSCTSLLKSNRVYIQSLKMADGGHVEEPKNFAPKTPVNLDPPKDDPITYEELSKCDGTILSSSPAQREGDSLSSRPYRLRLVETNPSSHQRHRLRRVRQRCLWTQRTISR
jgi:hypothetical protein